MDLKQHIRSIPDFPKPGILFYDIGTLLAAPEPFRAAVEQMAQATQPWAPTALAAVESRGFLFAAPMAVALGCGLVMVRKRGKLPGDVVVHEYDLEYGTDSIEVQESAIPRDGRIVIVDDLLATGGTVMAAATLLRQLGATIAGCQCLMELTFLDGRRRLESDAIPLQALLSYDS